MTGSDAASNLQQVVLDAIQSRRRLSIVGGGTKHFLGRAGSEEMVSTEQHWGITNYDPRELVLTARAGTRLADIAAALRDNGQMLPFEPPGFGSGATLGGTLACGLSGPRRPFVGAVRDFVLGTRLLNGRGEIVRFGGEVMKNVAGYDVSRLMVGAMGTLGVILEASLKVLPAPEYSITLVRSCAGQEAVAEMWSLAGKCLSVSAACFDGDNMYVRLEGTETAVQAGKRAVGGDLVKEGAQFWESIREQTHGFFRNANRLWRFSMPPTVPATPLSGKWFLDWAGAQRWYTGDEDETHLRSLASRHGGHVTLFRGDANQVKSVFQPLPAPLMVVHRRLKKAFDPDNLFNPGRMYQELI